MRFTLSDSLSRSYPVPKCSYVILTCCPLMLLLKPFHPQLIIGMLIWSAPAILVPGHRTPGASGNVLVLLPSPSRYNPATLSQSQWLFCPVFALFSVIPLLLSAFVTYCSYSTFSYSTFRAFRHSQIFGYSTLAPLIFTNFNYAILRYSVSCSRSTNVGRTRLQNVQNSMRAIVLRVRENGYAVTLQL